MLNHFDMNPDRPDPRVVASRRMSSEWRRARRDRFASLFALGFTLGVIVWVAAIIVVIHFVAKFW